MGQFDGDICKLKILGDFNIKSSAEKRQLEEMFESFGSFRVFLEPSRTTTRSSTCIDNMFTNLDSVDYKKCTMDLHLSDHLSQKLAIRRNHGTREIVYKYIRTINEANTIRFIDKLGCIN
ncbi:hypothetical protein HHI36_006068 [Cryptolaemus montrouzieri]|uniref:RRM domain-containing protein n=1 Tax=Cryptolaemus montrouzieri TaxID=559131 RepID=A0ABD2NW71_9CUCU